MNRPFEIVFHVGMCLVDLSYNDTPHRGVQYRLDFERLLTRSAFMVKFVLVAI